MAAASVGDDQESWMQTTVTAVAGDKVSFYGKVSSESGDYLKFYIDSQYQTGITGEVDWQKKSYSLTAGSHTLKWVYSKDSTGYAGEDCGWVDGLTVGTTSIAGRPDEMSEALDSNLKFTESGDTGWYIASGTTNEYYYEADSAQSGTTSDGEESCLQAIVDSDSSQTVKFYWKVSSHQGYDYLQFYIDSTLKDQISGEVGWQQMSYSVTSGIHILKWRYVKDGAARCWKCRLGDGRGGGTLIGSRETQEASGTLLRRTGLAFPLDEQACSNKMNSGTLFLAARGVMIPQCNIRHGPFARRWQKRRAGILRTLRTI